MAISKTYIVSFSPAERQAWGGYTISLSLVGAGTRHIVIGDLKHLEAEVRRLAGEYGRTCSPYIRQPSGDRAVPGFQALCKRLNILERVPTDAEVEAFMSARQDPMPHGSEAI